MNHFRRRTKWEPQPKHRRQILNHCLEVGNTKRQVSLPAAHEATGEQNQWDELSFSGNSMPLRKHESLPAAHEATGEIKHQGESMDDVPASFRQKLQRLRWKPEMILKNYRTATSGAARSGAQTPGFTSRVTDRDSRSHWGIEVRTKRDTRVACHPRFPRPTAWFGQSGDFLNSRACWISSRNLWREVEPENQWDELSFSGNSMPFLNSGEPAQHHFRRGTKWEQNVSRLTTHRAFLESLPAPPEGEGGAPDLLPPSWVWRALPARLEKEEGGALADRWSAGGARASAGRQRGDFRRRWK